jgi:hypothetical protein
MRPMVLWRQGSFGSDSESGSRFAERLLTVVASCRQQERRLLDFLVAAAPAALQRTARPSLLPTGRGGLNHSRHTAPGGERAGTSSTGVGAATILSSCIRA